MDQVNERTLFIREMNMRKNIILGIVYIIAIFAGAVFAIFVTKAIELAKIEACFDYKDPKVCEEVINEIRR